MLVAAKNVLHLGVIVEARSPITEVDQYKPGSRDGVFQPIGRKICSIPGFES